MTFSKLAQYFQKLERTPSRNAMTEILAELFKRASREEIGKICYLVQGRVAPLYEAIEFGLADKFIIRAISSAYTIDKAEVLKEFKRTGDLGIAAENCYHVPLHSSRRQRHSVSDVYQALYALTAVGGQGSQEKKIEMLASLLRNVDSLSARYIVRIPLDKLRLGFSDMTILDALSWMLTGDKSLRPKLEDAYNVQPDIGYISETVKKRGIKGLGQISAKVGVPVLAALCQRLPDADEMIEKMGKVAVEPKYDGVRVQIHYEAKSLPRRQAGDKRKAISIKTFSRNLENTTAMFPELQDIGKQVNAREVILDSEAIGYDAKTSKLISFQETMTRKRKHEIAHARANVPLKFFVFDMLFKDGKDLLNEPLSARRKALEETVKSGKILTISPQIVAETSKEIRRSHDEQLARGLEGVVVKKWNGLYEPGRRGFSWVKFKEEEGKTGKLTDSIDAVVMGYTAGEGKRTAFGIGQVLLGVRRGEDFVTVTKLGSGATEKELGMLFRTLKKLRVRKQPKEYKNVHKVYTPDFWVVPKLVLEVAGDDLTKSPTHGAGYAVRFPRLVRIRDDKSPREVTTVREVVTMFRNQKNAIH